METAKAENRVRMPDLTPVVRVGRTLELLVYDDLMGRLLMIMSA